MVAGSEPAERATNRRFASEAVRDDGLRVKTACRFESCRAHLNGCGLGAR